MKTKIIIFGITGDLSSKKLLPALIQVRAHEEFEDIRIYGVSRSDKSAEDVLGGDNRALLDCTTMVQMDMDSASDYERLRDEIDQKVDEQVLFYLSVPSSSTGAIISGLGGAGLNTEKIKLLIEKPFGSNVSSAQKMADQVTNHFDEKHIYRIDHYLAKEMAQNILIFRASNALFNSAWDNRFIERIDVTVNETMRITGRASFYEETGALRDVLQGHLIQLLALSMMDIPKSYDWDEVPDARNRVVQSLQPADTGFAVRGQYEEYATDIGKDSTATETFVSLRLSSDDPRWKGVDLRLTTGKALKEPLSQVKVYFKKADHAQANTLTFSLKPKEGIELGLYARKPGYDGGYRAKELHFDYATNEDVPDAYEQVFVDAIRSEKSLFVTNEEVIAAWKVVQPVLDAWDKNADGMKLYRAGSDGPEL